MDFESTIDGVAIIEIVVVVVVVVLRVIAVTASVLSSVETKEYGHGNLVKFTLSP